MLARVGERWSVGCAGREEGWGMEKGETDHPGHAEDDDQHGKDDARDGAAGETIVAVVDGAGVRRAVGWGVVFIVVCAGEDHGSFAR